MKNAAPEKQILLVGERSASLELLRGELNSRGCTVIPAESPDDIVPAISPLPVDCVVLKVDSGNCTAAVETASRLIDDYTLPVIFLGSGDPVLLLKQIAAIEHYGFLPEDSGPSVIGEAVMTACRLHKQAGNETFKQLVDNALVGVYIIRNKRVIYVNDEYYRIFGYQRGEFDVASGFLDLVVPESRKWVEENIERRLKGEEDIAEYEFSGLRKDGAVVDIRILSSAMTFRGVPTIFGILMDVTENNRTESMLRRKISLLSHPVDEVAELHFEDIFEMDEIQLLQDQFAGATGVASIITRPDGTPLTQPSNFTPLCRDIVRKSEVGLKNCIRSDTAIGRYNPGGPIIHTCHSCGLQDAGASIIIGGKHVANWLIGQVRNEAIDEESVLGYADEIGVDRKEFSDALQQVPFMREEQFQKVAGFLYSIANKLSFTAYQNLQQARFINEKRSIEEKLQQANKEKEIFLRDLQHRMKNSLAIISGLLSLEMEKLGDTIDPAGKVRGIFEDTIGRISAINDVYTHLKRDQGLNRIELVNFISDIVQQFARSYSGCPEQVHFLSQIEILTVDIKKTTNLGLILNELLTNAIKYAYPDDRCGKIEVILSRQDDDIRLTVKDYGGGLGEDFSDKDKGTGLQIIEVLVAEMKGEFFIGGSVGTEAVLTVPVS